MCVVGCAAVTRIRNVCVQEYGSPVDRLSVFTVGSAYERSYAWKGFMIQWLVGVIQVSVG